MVTTTQTDALTCLHGALVDLVLERGLGGTVTTSTPGHWRWICCACCCARCCSIASATAFPTATTTCALTLGTTTCAFTIGIAAKN